MTYKKLEIDIIPDEQMRIEPTPELLEMFEGRRQHAFNKIEWHVPKNLRGRFLDIGCGVGNGVVAALQHGFAMAVGIDRNLDEFPTFGLPVDRMCQEYGLDRNCALLIERDIFKIGIKPGTFECVLMLDTIEHVPDPASFIAYAANCLAPGGVLLVDTCPLYYSPTGAHLFNHFDQKAIPWVHLRHDFEDMVRSRGVDEWTMTRVEELNRVTHTEIRNAFTDAGLIVIQEHRSAPSPETTRMLDENRHLLNLDGIDESLLFEDWILLVGQCPLKALRL